MPFPLSEWIDRHSGAPHNLGKSGMRGSLRTALSGPPEGGSPDPGVLSSIVARSHRVSTDRVFLTPGATVGNTLALAFLYRQSGRSRAGRPRVRVSVPEYPPLLDTALELGYRRASPDAPAEVATVSAPANPRGVRLGPGDIERFRRRVREVVVDETYREFTPARSIQAARLPGTWSTGTLTKTYGADDIRVGWVIPPEEHTDLFRRFHGVAIDELPPHSVAWATATLRRRQRILAEARGLFRRNVAYLRRSVSDVPPLAAPVWFDRGRGGMDGDRVARSALRSGVLVCPGSFFGDPSGVRISLTRRSFPEDLDAYLAVRRRFVPE